jgi:hypothetical protein
VLAWRSIGAPNRRSTALPFLPARPASPEVALAPLLIRAVRVAFSATAQAGPSI